jgi:hypothetical protein
VPGRVRDRDGLLNDVAVVFGRVDGGLGPCRIEIAELQVCPPLSSRLSLYKKLAPTNA